MNVVEYRELSVVLQMVGAKLTYEQITELVHEAHEKFGVSKKILMLLLLGGCEDFREWIYGRASEMLKSDLRSEYRKTAKNAYGERLIDK